MVTDTSSTAVSQLPLHVNGLPMVGAPESHYALRAAIETLSDDCRAILAALRREQVAVLSDFFDPVGEMLSTLGVRWERIASEDLPLVQHRIAFAGCPHRHARLDASDLHAFFERGGVLVMSDRAAMMAGPGHYLPAGAGRGPGRTRVMLDPTLRDACLPDHLLPAVWLDPGHRPLREPLPDSVKVLAFDAMVGTPLVVLLPVNGGSILHAVPHWMQDSPTTVRTGFEDYRLIDVPSYAAVGNSYPQVSLGAYLSASVMLRLLLDGLRRSAWGAGAHVPAVEREEGA